MYKYEGDPLYNSTKFIYYVIHTSYNSFLTDTWVEYVSIQNVIRQVITSPSVSLELHLNSPFGLEKFLIFQSYFPSNIICGICCPWTDCVGYIFAKMLANPYGRRDKTECCWHCLPSFITVIRFTIFHLCLQNGSTVALKLGFVSESSAEGMLTNHYGIWVGRGVFGFSTSA